MSMKQVIEERLTDLSMNSYQLALKIAEERGTPEKGRDLSTQMSRLVGNPDGSKLKSVVEVVEALGGKLVIQWQDVKEVEV